jgi:hypothetical protein
MEVGPKTFKDTLNHGWIVQAGEDTYGADEYKITGAGLAVFKPRERGTGESGRRRPEQLS